MTVSDHETSANFRNRVHGKDDNLPGFIEAFKKLDFVPQPTKDLVASTAAEYMRVLGRGR